MIIKFQVENFRSFGQPVSFDTISGKYKRFDSHIHQINADLSILKATAIYGANGSGKTNLFKSLFFLKELATNQDFLTSKTARKINKPFLLDPKFKDQTSNFELDFSIDSKIYYYRIELQDEVILYENLSEVIDNEFKVIIERTTNQEDLIDQKVKIGSRDFDVANDEFLQTIFKPSSTVLSLGIGVTSKIKNWLSSKVNFLFPDYEIMDLPYILSRNINNLTIANKILSWANIGIKELVLNKYPINTYLGNQNLSLIEKIEDILKDQLFYSFKDSEDAYCSAIKENGETLILKLEAIHKDSNNHDVLFNLQQESRGTLVLLHLIPALILSYSEGVNYFIDEINRSLHPILIRELLEQYVEHNIKDAKGQIIFNSHEDFMMDEEIIRQDEVWFCEKDKHGQTTVYPLTDFGPRYDLKFRKNYLGGKFGAVPWDKKPPPLIFA